MKSYGQYCGVARSLDLVGDRWTLLIVRELSLGPRRYGELQAGLPGIATNLLADRLRQLAAAELVAAPTDADGTARYALTDRGRDLLPALHALVRWATPAMVPGPAPDDHEQPRWVAFAAQAYLQGAPTPISVRAELVCAATSIAIAAHDGTIAIEVADAPGADVRVEATSWALMALVSGSVTLDRIERVDPAATVEGTRAARRSLQRLVAHNTRLAPAP